MKRYLIIYFLFIPLLTFGQKFDNSLGVGKISFGKFGSGVGFGERYVYDYNDYADALFTRMTGLTNLDKLYISELFDTIGVDIYNKLDRLWKFNLNTPENSVVNWTNIDEDVTIQGTMTFIEYGGFIGDSVTSYINANYNPSTADAVRFKWDSASYGAYSNNEISQGSALMGLTKSDAAPLSYSFLSPRNSNAFIERTNNAGAAQPTVASTSTIGLFTGQREGTTTYAGINGVQVTNVTAGQSVLPNNNYYIMASCNAPNSVVLNRGKWKLSTAFIGGFLTQEQLSRLYRAIVRFDSHLTEGYSYEYGSFGPYICWVADDGTERDYTLLYKLAKWRGIKMTSAIITSYIDQESLLSTVQIEEMIAYGWEFASHSNTHENLTEISDVELGNELRISDSIITDLQGFCNTIAYPYNLVNLHIADSGRNYYSYGLDGNAGAAYQQINYSPILDMNILRSTLSLKTEDIQAMKDRILENSNNGGVLIFGTHASQWTTQDTTNLGILIDYATGLGTEQITVTDAMTKSDVISKIVIWE